jgi:lysophospholipase L1-like esterase
MVDLSTGSIPADNQKAARRKERLFALILLIGSLVLSLALLEIALRVLRPSSVTYYVHMPTIYQPDDIVGYRYIPGADDYIERDDYRIQSHINRAGFNDDEFTLERQPGVARIAVLGDSFTVGLHVERGQTFPDVLERLLSESGPVEVYNFGVDGYGTPNELALMDEVLTYDPDIVVLTLYENDIDDVKVDLYHRAIYRGYVIYYLDLDQYQQAVGEIDLYFANPLNRFLFWGREHTATIRAVNSLWITDDDLQFKSNRWRQTFRTTVNTELDELPDEAAVDLLIEDVLQMADRCEQHACDFVVVTLPTKKETEDPTRPYYAEPILAALDAEGIDTLSLLDPLREAVEQGPYPFYPHDNHCNAAGYEIIARALADHLQSGALSN